MTREELLARLASLRQARVGQVRVSHKPLLLLWLFGQFAATGSSAVSYQQAEEPVSQLINDFGPPVASAAAARQRAAMPFVHLERELWDLRDAAGREIGPDAPERRAWLLERGAVGRLRSPVERLLADPGTLAAVTRLLLEQHFTPVLAELICVAVDLDVAALDLAGNGRTSQAVRSRPRRRGFAEEVLRAYAYQCAMCGFDGALGRYPVGIEAAHVRWHSQEGPDEIPNALALCALHHALFDLGVVGITEDRRICVSGLYVARNEAGRAVDELAGKPLLIPRPRQPKVDVIYIAWHSRQVFKAPRGTKLRTQALEEHLPGLPRDHQFRPVGLVGVAHRHKTGLSSRWAWYPTQEPAGKVVWCEIEALSPTRRGVGEGREPPFVRINRPADMGAVGQRGRRASPGLAVILGQGSRPGSSGRSAGTAGLVSAAGGQATSTWPGLSALGAGKAAPAAKIWHLPNAAAAGLRRVWYLAAIVCPAEPGAFVVQAGPHMNPAGDVPAQSASERLTRRRRTGTAHRLRRIAREAMMVNSYYGIYQAERGKTTAEIRAADAQLGGLAAELGQLGSALADPSPLTTVPRPREDGEQEVMVPMRWRDAIVDGQDTTGLSLVLPCTEDPELFFAESPQDVEQAKAMCRECRARSACLAGALERREPWGVWGGELLTSGAIVRHKRPRGRPRKDVVTIGANA